MIKFSLNPINGHFIEAGLSNHAESIHNVADFDKYVRGIIKDGILYLRTYYPYNDIENLSLEKLNQYSAELLKQYQVQILKTIKRQYDFVPCRIVFNVDNVLLKGVLQTNFI